MNEATYAPGATLQANRAIGVDYTQNDSEGQQPLPPKRNKPRLISIQPLDHGFNVVVGCQNFAVESVDALIHRLNVYLKNPDDTEQKWLSGKWKF